MYEGSDDGSNCDGYNSPGDSMSEFDLSEDGPTFSPDGSPIIIPRTPPPRPSNRIFSRCLFDDTSHRGTGLKRTPFVSRQQSDLSQPGTMHNQMEAILKELRQANNRLSDVTNRLDVVEGCLKGLEESSTSPCSIWCEIFTRLKWSCQTHFLDLISSMLCYYHILYNVICY